MLRLIPFTVLVPQKDGTTATTEMDINPEQVACVQKIRIATAMVGPNKQPSTKAGSGMLVAGNMFVVDMKKEEVLRILLGETENDDAETPKESI